MTDPSTFSVILACFGFFCVALSFIADIYLYFTIGRKFDKIFGHIESADAWTWFGGYTMGRLNCYTALINGYEAHKELNTRIFQLFGGYNFREHVTPFQLVMIKVDDYSFYVGIASLFVTAILMHISFFKLWVIAIVIAGVAYVAGHTIKALFEKKYDQFHHNH